MSGIVWQLLAAPSWYIIVVQLVVSLITGAMNVI
jgi:hypothetical protein